MVEKSKSKSIIYRVVDVKGKNCIYEGCNKAKAIKILDKYNGICGNWYLEVIRGKDGINNGF